MDVWRTVAVHDAVITGVVLVGPSALALAWGARRSRRSAASVSDSPPTPTPMPIDLGVRG